MAAQSLLAQSVPLMRAAGARRDLMQSLLTAGTVRLKQGDQQQVHNLYCAFLKDAPILILDEPTVHLDAITERAVLGPALRKTPRSRKVDKCGTVFG